MKLSSGQQEESDLAGAYGFESFPDQQRGAGWCAFRQGDIHVWISRYGWSRARVLEDCYRYHTRHETLEEALSGDGGRPYGPDDPRKRSPLSALV